MRAPILSFTIFDTRSDHLVALGHGPWPGHELRPTQVRGDAVYVKDVQILGVYTVPDSNNNDVLISMLKTSAEPIDLYRNSAPFYRISGENYKNEAFVHTSVGLRRLTVPQGSIPQMPAYLRPLGDRDRVQCQNRHLREFLRAYVNRPLDQLRLFLRGIERLLRETEDLTVSPGKQEQALFEMWHDVWGENDPTGLETHGRNSTEMIEALFAGLDRFAIESIALRVAGFCRQRSA